MIRQRNRGRRWLTVLWSLLLLASVVGVLGKAAGSPDRAALVGATTVSVGATISPQDITVAPGTTVTWTSVDGRRFRIRATSGPVEFDSGDIDPSTSWSFTFATVGTYSYVNHRDETLRGTVTVGAGAPGPGGGTGGPPPPTTASVHMAGQAFGPRTVTVAVGGVVTWTNNDSSPHNVTSNNGVFTSTTMQPGAVFTFRFTTPGTYGYVCTFHGGMSGTIIVPTASGSVPPPPPPAPQPKPKKAPPPPASTGNFKTYEIRAQEMSFAPTTQSAHVGDTISWVNVGSVPHTVTAKNGSFNRTLAPGERFNLRLTTQGTIAYVCTFHPGMDGVLIVGPPLAAVALPTGSDIAGDTASATPHRHGTATTYEVQVKDNSFAPGMLNAHVGDTISWVNVGVIPHTVTARNGSFDKTLAPGEHFDLLLTSEGNIDYVCTPHTGMFGMLMVGPAPANPNAAGPALSLGTIAPVSMALLGTGLLLLLGLFAVGQARTRSISPQSQPITSEDAS